MTEHADTHHHSLFKMLNYITIFTILSHLQDINRLLLTSNLVFLIVAVLPFETFLIICTSEHTDTQIIKKKKGIPGTQEVIPLHFAFTVSSIFLLPLKA